MSDGSSKTQIAHNGDYVTITKSTRRSKIGRKEGEREIRREGEKE